MDIKESYYEGILEKPGVIPGKKTKVWCILDTKGMELIFYRENRRSSCIGSEDLSNVTAVSQLGAKSVSKDFEISAVGGRAVTYSAESPESCQEWIKRISDVIGDDKQKQTDSSVEKKQRHPSASMQEVDDLLKQKEKKHNSVNDRIKRFQTVQQKTDTETGNKIIQEKRSFRRVSQENKQNNVEAQHTSNVEAKEYHGNNEKLVNRNPSSATVDSEQGSECVSSAIQCDNNMDNSYTKIKDDVVGHESEMKCEKVNDQDVKIIGGQNLNTQQCTNELSDVESDQTSKNNFDKNEQIADILAGDENKNLKNDTIVDDEPEEAVVMRRSRYKQEQSYTSDETAPKKEIDTDLSNNSNKEGSMYSTSQNVATTSTENNKQTNDKDLEASFQDDTDEYEPVVMRRSKMTTSSSFTNQQFSESQATEGTLNQGNKQEDEKMNKDDEEPVVLRRSNFKKMKSESKKSEEEEEDLVDGRYKTITKENCSIYLEKNQTDVDDDKEECEVSLQFRSEEIEDQTTRDSISAESASTVDSDDGQLTDGLLTEEQEYLLYNLTFDPIPPLPHSSSNSVDTHEFDDLIDLCGKDLITNFDERRASSYKSDDVIEQLQNLLKPVQ